MYVVGFEVGQCFGLCVLVFVVMDCGGWQVVFGQVFGEMVGVVFGMGEDQYLFLGVDGYQVCQQGVFLWCWQVEYVLFDVFDCGVWWCYFDVFWVVQEFVGEVDDVF